MNRARVLMVVLALWSAGCASTPETAVLPPDEQFARAREAYEEGDYREAIANFQTFSFNYPQDPRVPEARWMTAQGYYRVEDWATAAQEFLNFQRDQSRDERAAEALFQAGRAYQQMSLRPELDQRETERAVNAYDRVIVEYPRSEFVEEARSRKAQLRDKLAEKVFLNAEFYFDNENYSATEIYLTDLIATYTDTSWIPPAYALLARTKCQQGLGDRASEVYSRLRENYPESQAAREVVGELPERCRATQAASDGESPAPTGGR
jgi:outer membrane protein assembly factor BamD